MTSCLQKIYNCICCVSTAQYPTPYQFEFNGQDYFQTNKVNFESNFVKTSKYTWYSFLPKALLLQFKRIANVYFLFIAILQTIPIISPLNPLTAWAPLIFVLAISMIREGYEDFQRYRADNQQNHETHTIVRRNGQFVRVQWSDVIVGDICKVEQEQLFAADMILLNSSIEGGVAFIQTASLDGQKNLKPRSAFKKTIETFNDPNNSVDLNKTHGQWKGIIPDKQLHKFSSTMVLDGQNIVFEGDKQLLYRGARLKNTKWIMGLVIYTGQNTKIMLNSQSSSEKMSQIEIKVNRILFLIFLFQVVISMVIAILYGFFRNANEANISYYTWPAQPVPVDSLLIFFTYIVLINTMIPISLVVSIEIVKVAQSIFIKADKLMYSEFRKKQVDVKSASLNQQLGQIQYVFSDKTGTLTMNLMEFKIAVIGNKMFGDLGLIMNDPSRPPQTEKGFRDDKLEKLLTQGEGNSNLDTTIQVKGGKNMSFSNLKSLAEQYFMALSTAHQVVAEPNKQGKIIYQGPSPDEISLVEAAKQIGYQFVKSTQSSTTVKILGNEKTFELMEVFPFTSDRKRMSVILKINGSLVMYMKGADSIVKGRLASDSRLNLDDELNRFSRIGLRTLLVAMRTISDSEYQSFKKNVQDLPPTNKQTQFQELVSKLENNMYIIGATAVLDRLQDFVPQTIRDLIRANIKVWMLTGDKMQTAENIAKSCNLIQSSFDILRYVNKGEQQVISTLKELVAQSNELTQTGVQKALLIEGADLTPILATDQGQTELANLAKNCEAVVCCRLLPIQKAQVVSVVRQKLNKITLSIGDGANDVPMIKTAHIGVGLFGQEGMGAVQSSDYALPEFRMLWRLLLVHGRWNYIRISEMILYFFYKNMLFTIPQVVFAFYCAYSGQTLFDDLFIAFYNLFFTSVPLVVRAILEQDVNYVVKKQKKVGEPTQNQTMMEIVKKKSPVLERQQKYLSDEFGVNSFLYKLFPKIYFIGQQNCIFNYTNFFLWIAEAIIQSILLTLFVIYIIGETSLNENGLNTDAWIIGITIYSGIILIVTFKLATHTRFWSGLLIFSIIILSLGLYVAYMWIANSTFSEHILGTVTVSWTNGECYFVITFGICFLLFLDGIVIHIDLINSGAISKMRTIIAHEKHQSKTYYDQMSLKMTQGLSHAPHIQ